jgi:Flp pilus assembly protein TadD
MRKDLQPFYWLYCRPSAAVNAILDSGSVARSIVFAVIVVVLLFFAGSRRPDDPFLEQAFDAQRLARVGAGPAWHVPALLAASKAMAFVVPSSLMPPLVIAIALLPVLILILAKWQGTSSFGVAIARDYTALLAIALAAWSAAYLPFAVLGFIVPRDRAPIVDLAAGGAAQAFFLVVLAIGARAVTGVGGGPLAAGLSSAWVASIVVYAASGIWTPLLLWLASPWVIYMLWGPLQAEGRALGRGLGDRQALKRSLEAAAINPRDADAQYQLGLVYAGRRSFDQARERFESAVAIDPELAEAHHELGRIAIAQGRFGDAVASLRRAAQLNDKLSTSEVLRDLGLALLKSGDTAGAVQVLARFTERRAYDPEGLVYYGQALQQVGSAAQARAAFESAIEAADSMPSHRRAAGRAWARQAKQALRSL